MVSSGENGLISVAQLILIYRFNHCTPINLSRSKNTKHNQSFNVLQQPTPNRVYFNHFLCGVWTIGSYLQLFWPLSTREEQKDDRITLLRNRCSMTVWQVVRGVLMHGPMECGTFYKGALCKTPWYWNVWPLTFNSEWRSLFTTMTRSEQNHAGISVTHMHKCKQCILLLSIFSCEHMHCWCTHKKPTCNKSILWSFEPIKRIKILQSHSKAIASTFSTCKSFLPSSVVCHNELGSILLLCLCLQTWKLSLDGFVNQCPLFFCVLLHLQIESGARTCHMC